MSPKSIIPFRQRLLEDMAVRHFSAKSTHDSLRHIDRFLAFLLHAQKSSLCCRPTGAASPSIPQPLSMGSAYLWPPNRASLAKNEQVSQKAAAPSAPDLLKSP